MGRYFGVALLLPVSTFVGYAIGYLLDRAFGTGFLKIIFLIRQSGAEQPGQLGWLRRAAWQ